MNRFTFIINPIAGNVLSSGIINKLSALESSDPENYKVIFTERPAHATAIAKNLTKNSFATNIVAVGGDGTINEIINGFNLNSPSSLAVLPYGSGNDVSRFLYKKHSKFLETIIKPDLTETMTYDIGIAEIIDANENVIRKKFINAVGIGFDAYVAYLNQHEKVLSGIPSYLIAVLKALKSSTGIDMKILIGNKMITQKCLLVTIGNGKTSGGGFFLNPDADPTDGELNITTVEFGPRSEILRNLPFALINKLHRVKKARFYKGNSICLELSSPYYVHLDGEIASKEAVKIKVKLNGKIKIMREK
ncbi:MAG: diacylglycerol kinase family protein [Melioribacteraceae bacterium]|nr:diacylglycerol kinase family protein [Melioribacteraceae bacterium]